MELIGMNTNKRSDLMKSKYLKINTRDLQIPKHAQRGFNQRHADELARKWSMEKYKPIDVSFRNGKYWIIDGQHRVAALKQIHGGDCTILCYVHYGMTELDESMFFLGQLDDTKPILTTDKMRIRYITGDDVVVGMVRGAEKAGFSVDFATNKANNRIVALAALEQVYKALGYNDYVDMLVTLKKAYHGRSDSLCREILLGMAFFFKTYKGEFKPGVLADCLMKNTTPMDIVIEGRSYGKSKNGKGGLYNARPFALAILNVYNKRRSNRLENKF